MHAAHRSDQIRSDDISLTVCRAEACQAGMLPAQSTGYARGLSTVGLSVAAAIGAQSEVSHATHPSGRRFISSVVWDKRAAGPCRGCTEKKTEARSFARFGMPPWFAHWRHVAWPFRSRPNGPRAVGICVAAVFTLPSVICLSYLSPRGWSVLKDYECSSSGRVVRCMFSGSVNTTQAQFGK